MNAQKASQNVLEDISVKMNEVATSAVATGNRVSTTRIVGFTALAYAASLIAQNAVFVVSGAPDYYAYPHCQDHKSAKVSSYYRMSYQS